MFWNKVFINPLLYYLLLYQLKTCGIFTWTHIAHVRYHTLVHGPMGIYVPCCWGYILHIRLFHILYRNTGSHLETLVSLYTSSGFEPFFLEVCTEILGTTVLSDGAPLTKCSDFVSDLRSLQEILISFVIFCTRSGIGWILFLRRKSGEREPPLIAHRSPKSTF